jgi:hypothetical protein
MTARAGRAMALTDPRRPLMLGAMPTKCFIGSLVVAGAALLALTTTGCAGGSAVDTGGASSGTGGGGIEEAMTLASTEGDVQVTALAVDAANIYWVSRSGTVSKTSLGGGAPIQLANLEDQLWDIAISATSIYCIGGGVYVVPLEGGTPTRLAMGGGQGIAVDATSVYWTAMSTIEKMPLGGGSPTTIGSGQQPAILTLDAKNVYWADMLANTISQASLDGGDQVTLASDPAGPPQGLAVGASRVFWSNNDPMGIAEVPAGGGSVTSIADMGGPWGVAADETHVYWADAGSGDIRKMPLGGGPVVTLVSVPPGAQRGSPRPIVVDATSVYWADVNANTINKAAK